MENERNNYLSTYTTQKQINTICVYIYIYIKKSMCGLYDWEWWFPSKKDNWWKEFADKRPIPYKLFSYY